MSGIAGRRAVRASEPTEAELAADVQADLTIVAARRVHTSVSALVALATLGMAAMVGLGATFIAHGGSDRTTGVAIIAAGVAGWLQILLVCFVADAVARYFDWRVLESRAMTGGGF